MWPLCTFMNLIFNSGHIYSSELYCMLIIFAERADKIFMVKHCLSFELSQKQQKPIYRHLPIHSQTEKCCFVMLEFQEILQNM